MLVSDTKTSAEHRTAKLLKSSKKTVDAHRQPSRRQGRPGKRRSSKGWPRRPRGRGARPRARPAPRLAPPSDAPVAHLTHYPHRREASELWSIRVSHTAIFVTSILFTCWKRFLLSTMENYDFYDYFMFVRFIFKYFVLIYYFF